MGPIDPLTGDSAVRQVLDAEREARERIASARAEAERALEQARAEARAVEQRAVEAARQAQQSARAFGEQRLARLQAETGTLLEAARRDNPETAIDAIACQLARELIGADAGPDQGSGPGPDA